MGHHAVVGERGADVTSRWADLPVSEVRRLLSQTYARIHALREQASSMEEHLNAEGFIQARKHYERQQREGAHRAA